MSDNTKSQNHYTVNNVDYVAVDAYKFHTTGTKCCSETCDAYEVCLEAGMCLPKRRQDRRNIVWKATKGE